MEEVYPLIRKHARDYLPVDAIEDFIQRLAHWEKEIRSCFYQVTQAGDAPGLEFGALLPGALLDITAGQGQVVTTLIPIQTVTSLRTLEDAGSITLQVHTGGNIQLSYQAAQETTRLDLKAYAGDVQLALVHDVKSGARHTRVG